MSTPLDDPGEVGVTVFVYATDDPPDDNGQLDYSVPTWSTAERPLRDALPGFQADRGGLRYVTPPDIGVPQVRGDDGVDLWPEILTRTRTEEVEVPAAYDYARDRAELQAWLDAPIPKRMAPLTDQGGCEYVGPPTECWRCTSLPAIDPVGLCGPCGAAMRKG